MYLDSQYPYPQLTITPLLILLFMVRKREECQNQAHPQTAEQDFVIVLIIRNIPSQLPGTHGNKMCQQQLPRDNALLSLLYVPLQFVYPPPTHKATFSLPISLFFSPFSQMQLLYPFPLINLPCDTIAPCDFAGTHCLVPPLNHAMSLLACIRSFTRRR